MGAPDDVGPGGYRRFILTRTPRRRGSRCNRLVTAGGNLAQRLAGAGFVAAADEAAELLEAADGDASRLERLVARRLNGEPLEWITGWVGFSGLRLRVARGVYVPRWHTEALAELAARCLPEAGLAIDICCGSGAIAAVLSARRPQAKVLATDLDPRAVACARGNGVDARIGDLFDGLPDELRGTVDLVTGVVPHVPTRDLGLLQRDTLTFESVLAYDGGPDGMSILRRAAAGAARWLRPDGTLLLGLGGSQASELALAGFEDRVVIRDADGDVRGVHARRGPAPSWR
jgi:release factor glutamine methyltransferase